jgi:integrase
LTKLETASRIRGRILGKQNAVRDISHHAALPFEDMPDFMIALREAEGLSAVEIALCILTAARTSEALGATWGEVDTDAKTWTVPKGRMKTRPEHVVPLSAQALGIINALPRGAPDAFLFPG